MSEQSINGTILTIQNNNLKVKVNSYGGELTSICRDGVEYLWQGNPEYWSGQSPLLFPIVGHLKDGTIKIRGKQCFLKNHGFLQTTHFVVASHTEQELVLATSYNEDTLECYPYKFKFTVMFSVQGDTLEVKYNIENLDEETMAYNFGLHPGFNCSLKDQEVIENYYIEFPEAKTLDTLLFNDDIRVELGQTKRIIEKSTCFEFEDELFHRTLIMRDVDLHAMWLGHKEKGNFFKFSYEGFGSFALYRPVGAPFICLEPWTGSDSIVQDFESLEENPTIQFLGVGENKEFKMKIEF